MIIALAQINPVIGALSDNADKVLSFSQRARAQGAELIIFPELSLTGYPPHDLLEHNDFVGAEKSAREAVMQEVPADLGVIIGGLTHNRERYGKPLHNAAFLYEEGKKIGMATKALLPTYDVFDERRHFEPGRSRSVIHWRGRALGIHICEDLWSSHPEVPSLYNINPLAELAADGAEIFINSSASPFTSRARETRTTLITHSATTHNLPYVFVNQVGANSELVFDGHSGVFGPDGSSLVQAPGFEESLSFWVWDDRPKAAASLMFDVEQDLHDALVLGIRDYFTKTHAFSKAVVGLSGGIDSAVTCALAVRALGADRVVGVSMPSKYSSAGSIEDAVSLADALEIPLHILPIHSPVSALHEALAEPFADTSPDVTEENIQARVRGLMLMALSNKFGYLVLSTGNKSEMSVGYATLYGDMNGGLGILGDLYKGQVYALARFINAGGTVIPEATITKPPSAELRPDQTDQDSLPPYNVLDTILQRYIENQEGLTEIIEATRVRFFPGSTNPADGRPERI